MNPLWRFSLDRYGRPGVSENCLWAQDSLGADVNIVFLCLFAGERGIALRQEQLREIQCGDASAWHRSVVAPLRAARRAMKSSLQTLPVVEVEELRSQVKLVELESEKIELSLLSVALQGVSAHRISIEERRRTAANNLALYFLGIGAAQHSSEIDNVVASLVDLCISPEAT